MRAQFAALASLLVSVASCGGMSNAPASSVSAIETQTVSSAFAAQPIDPKEVAEQETRELVSAMIARVASARGLRVLKPVTSRTLDRPGMLARIREQVEKDMPMDIVAYQGEALAALELVPPDYDFIAGTYKLIEGQIAGFYTPLDATMYLADDLTESEAEETLAHELVHALQDQSYSLATMLKYAPGDSDRLSAAHALIEGDATSAMLDVVSGSAFNVSESMLRRLLSISTALSTVGASTPRVLQSSLTAPYADGFAFVQQLRRRGGWKAVDDVWRSLPTTTEQLLHLDKLDAREPPLEVAPIALDALGAGWRVILDDIMGEQGLRIILEEWSHLGAAREGAAGWGGDRYIVARKDLPDDSNRREIVLGWHMRLDTVADARQIALILEARFGIGCKLRSTVGPVIWKARGRDIVLTAGPYERQGLVPKSTGSCALTEKWTDAILKGALTAHSP